MMVSNCPACPVKALGSISTTKNTSSETIYLHLKPNPEAGEKAKLR